MSTTRKNRKGVSKNYIVAIPSYNRPDVISQKTLKTLSEGGVPAKQVYIFVANKVEEKRYLDAVPKELYGKIVVGKKGITHQRRFIVKYFPEGQLVVSADDDVEGLFLRKSEKALEKVTDVHGLFNDAFSRLKKEGLYLWGVYPVQNPFFMKDTVTTDLKFIIGTIYGFINRHTKTIQPSPTIAEKEDYEQSIRYFIKDGGVLRYNNITFKAKKHAPGGLGETSGRLEANRFAADYLVKTYPDYVSIFHRDNGMTEVRMARHKRIGDESP